jgi:hypothetical protein
MLIVTEKDRVDRFKLRRFQCGTGSFSQCDRTIREFAAGRIEGGIGQEPQTIDLQKRSRTTDQCDSHGFPMPGTRKSIHNFLEGF